MAGIQTSKVVTKFAEFNGGAMNFCMLISLEVEQILIRPFL
jgi:hypothetical protein